MPKILGIDPGLIKTGWGIVNAEGSTLKFIAAGTIRPNATAPLSNRLLELFNGIKKVIEEAKPDVSAVEETFVNKNPMSSLKLGQARGVIIFSLSYCGLQVNEYAANLVKKSLTGVGRAEKKQMAMMVKQILPTAQIDSEDAADALAVAICHASHMNIAARLSKSNFKT